MGREDKVMAPTDVCLIEMKNIQIHLRFNNNKDQTIEFLNSKELIDNFFPQDGTPLLSLYIEVSTEDGKVITITFPNDDRVKIPVRIEELV